MRRSRRQWWLGSSFATASAVVAVACGVDLQGTLGETVVPAEASGDGAGSVDAFAPDAEADAGADASCALGDGGDGILCGGACVDPSRDRANCGSCDTACSAASACEGTCVVVAASLAAFRIEQPCTDDSTPYCDTGATPTSKVVLLTGTQGTSYDLTLRFRGVVEQKRYDGASAAAAVGMKPELFGIGGTPAVDNWNDYSLRVSQPGLIFRLNRGTSGHDYVDRIDYTATVRAAAGATLALSVDPIDDRQAKNRDNQGDAVVVPDIPPAPSAFDGQFIQVDVTGVRVAP